ncbi:hypothetical protein K501DRAFT_333581 [Backusella circina FSU 941]|nr:hypothetical protein K501DRAFT_333581 [Backusella circina FSU 941]
MEEIEETHVMIQQMEELLAATPEDAELLQALSDLYDILNKQLSQANTNQQQPEEQELYDTEWESIAEELLINGSIVLYRSQEETGEQWKTGQITQRLDGPQWQVCTLESTIITVGLQDIRPFQQDNSTDHSDNESITELNSQQEEEHDDQFDIVPKHWGGWEAHSTGFASKMMSKMGYVPGQGLGVSGQGRLEPIEAQLNVKGKHRQSNSNMNRPGLGLTFKKQPKKKKNKEKAVEKEEEVDMFGFMDTLLSNKQFKQPEKPSSSSSPSVLPSTHREANKSLAKLQSNIESTQIEYNSAVAAVRRNKGKPMERQFQAKLEKISISLADLKNQANALNGHVKRKRERESMHTF